MEQVIIRTAKLSDLDTLLRFEQNVIQAERPFDPTLKPSAINYYDISGLITAAHVNLVVAELPSGIIGCGYARIEDSKIYLNHTRHAYLGFMYTEPEHRGKGVNKLVIDTLKKWALAQGINELKLEVYYENLPAIKAYEKVGFSKLMISMHISIA